jgi:hypothetical protein
MFRNVALGFGLGFFFLGWGAVACYFEDGVESSGAMKGGTCSEHLGDVAASQGFC